MNRNSRLEIEIQVISWVKWISDTWISRKEVCVIYKRSEFVRQLTFKIKLDRRGLPNEFVQMYTCIIFIVKIVYK